VPSARNPSAKPAATIINATARTRSVIEDLRARLAAEVPDHSPPPAPASTGEPVDELERELQAYFDRAAPKSGHASRDQLLEDLRNRVIDCVVDRILAEWALSPAAAPHCLGLGRDVMDRLIERILNEFRRTASS
jgi:hypothetical protein